MVFKEIKIQAILFLRKNKIVLYRRALLFFLGIFFICTYIFVISTFIDLPFDRQKLVSLKPMSWGETIKYEWEGCTSFESIPEYEGYPPEDEDKLKNVCFIKVKLKDSRFFANALNIDSTALQRQICIKGDASFIPEEERANGTSVWDSRMFGKISKDDKCLLLNSDLDSETFLPIKIFPGIVTNYLERNLVYGVRAILAVYVLSFLFTFVIWKSIIETLSFIRRQLFK